LLRPFPGSTEPPKNFPVFLLERFFVIKAAAYEPHVDRCTTAVHDAQPGDMAKLYHEKTTKGIFKST